MQEQDKIPAIERDYLRERAKLQLEYAKLPVMAERAKLWKLHNSLKGPRPMIMVDDDSFFHDIIPPRVCEHPIAHIIEEALNQKIAAHELIDCDKVTPDFYTVFRRVGIQLFGLPVQHNEHEGHLGFNVIANFKTMEEGLKTIKPSVFHYDKAGTEREIAITQDIIGDILPVKVKTQSVWWDFTITWSLTNLIRMDNLYIALSEEPEGFHQIMRRATDDLIAYLRWQEDNGLLNLNNGNDYTGSGNICFTDELPQKDFDYASGKVRSTDLWGHMNAQEMIGVSPAMYKEFIFPYYTEIASQFGLLYYGCCEPVQGIYDIAKNYPHLRKVSISPWCDEALMADKLRGGNVIYSRHPSANYLGVTPEFDEEAFTNDLKKTVSLIGKQNGGGIKAEFLYRDICAIHGNTAKLKRAVGIARQITEEVY
jgi:hypothetical protein